MHESARRAMTLGIGVVASVGAVAGATIFTMGAVRLRGWAATRMQQMDEIAALLRLSLGQGNAADRDSHE